MFPKVAGARTIVPEAEVVSLTENKLLLECVFSELKYQLTDIELLRSGQSAEHLKRMKYW